MTTKFEYSDMSTTDYNGQRWYSVDDDTVFPSITTVLNISMPTEKKKSLENWRTMLGEVAATKKMKQATTRGTHVHAMLEQLLKGEVVQTQGVLPEDVDVFNSLKLSLRGITEIYGQEMALCSRVLQVAGRCDLAGKWKGEEAIIDFKTSGRSKDEKEIQDYWVQCAFYAMAHNEQYGTNIEKGVILMGVAGGLPQIFVKDLIPYIGQLIERIEIFYKSL
jgi:ATP-dependent exoDNAse (exonuclease V) beta subunit